MTIFFFFFSVYILPLGNKPNKKRRFTSRDTTWYGEDSRNKQIGDYLDHFLFFFFTDLFIQMVFFYSACDEFHSFVFLSFCLVSSKLETLVFHIGCVGGGGRKKNGEIGDKRQTPTRK